MQREQREIGGRTLMRDSSYGEGAGGNDAFYSVDGTARYGSDSDKEQNSYYGVKLGEVLLF